MRDAGSLVSQVETARNYDANQSFYYHGWVVPEYRCFCMTIPKVACTTVKVALYHLSGNPVPRDHSDVHSSRLGVFLGEHTGEEIAEILTAPDWTRFCFVRNPYDRLFSAYKSKIGNTWDTQYSWLRGGIREACSYPVEDGRRCGMVTFTDFVQFLSDCRAKVRYEFHPDGPYDGHFNVQSHILKQDLIRYDVVGRFENLSKDLASSLARVGAKEGTTAIASERRNPTPQVPLSWAYNRELAALAYDIYREDFEAFGYERGSWLSDA